MTDVIKLSELSPDQVPQKLRVDYYFDFAAHPFAHASLLTGAKSVIDVLGKIGGYAKSWLAAKIEQLGKAKSVRVLTEKDFPHRGTGCFRALVAEGAEFDPSYYIGNPPGKSPRHDLPRCRREVPRRGRLSERGRHLHRLPIRWSSPP